MLPHRQSAACTIILVHQSSQAPSTRTAIDGEATKITGQCPPLAYKSQCRAALLHHANHANHTKPFALRPLTRLSPCSERAAPCGSLSLGYSQQGS